ncbi:TRAP transporter small permease [Wenxinia marina]|uniref:TRAP transporter small permease protein n=1 Tax=Wenxinia marina DSM 24838 TaxID=1123501 RepID=A0A0D0NQ53_9RHOB|nr:TRAP transporter small permease [Wenxinia marina]KIQ70415.1 TRAP-type C4-dicarboxylate transport system, small permease component [Wenxinia marina DSM 24838]GGL53339.1 hypothetical protein GCM10011392_04620 [Wenxinia marina]
MDLAVRVTSHISRILALIGAIAVVVMMVHICVDVVSRNLFRVSFDITNATVARYYMVPLAFLPLAWIELRGEMISVELVDGFLSPGVRWVSDLIVAAVTTVIYAALTYATWGSMMSNWRRGTMIELGQTPYATWPSYIFPTVGFALATLAVAVRLADTMRRGAGHKGRTA